MFFEVKEMKFMEKAGLFVLGGGGYVLLELLWRGWSHVSMFFAGGSCFLILGRLDRVRLPLPARWAAGAGAVTGVELVTGLLVNRDYGVWDYRGLPLNFMGQICLPFTLLWLPVSAVAMYLYRRAQAVPALLSRKGNPSGERRR